MIHKTLLLLLIASATGHAFAQTPQRMGFQAVVRDGDGLLVTGTTVGMRISVLQGSDTGTPVFVETHAPQTNANGLATLEIGGGNVISGVFAAIDWANGPYFLKTETDPNGGTNYGIVGTSPLLSVPYALHAANSQPGPQGPQGPPGTSDCPIIRTADGRAVVWTATTAHGWGLAATGGTQWFSTNINGPILGSIASDSSVVIWTATTAYGFYPSSTGGSIWGNTSLSGPVIGAVASSGRIAVFTETQAHGLGRASTSGMQWSTVNLAGPVIDHVVAGNRIVLLTSTTAVGYGLASTGGSIWSTTNLPSVPLGVDGTR
ncbi:MAG: hypothetical protein KIT10_05335 [Flavobacteriales bacterium]|nr:hypothetical protein [Flavobacteriales bacterium]